MQSRVRSMLRRRDEALRSRGESIMSTEGLKAISVKKVPEVEQIVMPQVVRQIFNQETLNTWGLSFTQIRQNAKIMLIYGLLLRSKLADSSTIRRITLYTLNLFSPVLGVSPSGSIGLNNPQIRLLLSDLVNPNEHSDADFNLRCRASYLYNCAQQALGAHPENGALHQLVFSLPDVAFPPDLRDLARDSQPMAAAEMEAGCLVLCKHWSSNLTKAVMITSLFSLLEEENLDWERTDSFFIQALFHLLMTLRSGGTITQRSFDKKWTALTAELPTLIDPTYLIRGIDSPECITITYSHLRGILASTGFLAKDVVRALAKLCNALREKVLTPVILINQIALAGQTTIALIIQATTVLGMDLIYLLKKFSVLRVEFAAFWSYLQALSGNAYLGIHISGISGKIPNLAYLSYSILKNYKGQKSLENYRGIGNPEHSAHVALRRFIDAFVAKLIEEQGAMLQAIAPLEEGMSEVSRMEGVEGYTRYVTGLMSSLKTKLEVGPIDDQDDESGDAQGRIGGDDDGSDDDGFPPSNPRPPTGESGHTRKRTREFRPEGEGSPEFKRAGTPSTAPSQAREPGTLKSMEVGSDDDNESVTSQTRGKKSEKLPKKGKSTAPAKNSTAYQTRSHGKPKVAARLAPGQSTLFLEQERAEGPALSQTDEDRLLDPPEETDESSSGGPSNLQQQIGGIGSISRNLGRGGAPMEQ